MLLVLAIILCALGTDLLVEGVGPLSAGALVAMHGGSVLLEPLAQIGQVAGGWELAQVDVVLITNILTRYELPTRSSRISSSSIISCHRPVILARNRRVAVGRRCCLLEMLDAAQQVVKVLVEVMVSSLAATMVATSDCQAASAVGLDERGRGMPDVVVDNLAIAVIEIVAASHS